MEQEWSQNTPKQRDPCGIPVAWILLKSIQWNLWISEKGKKDPKGDLVRGEVDVKGLGLT
jgi:hypothetical protein